MSNTTRENMKILYDKRRKAGLRVLHLAIRPEMADRLYEEYYRLCGEHDVPDNLRTRQRKSK